MALSRGHLTVRELPDLGSALRSVALLVAISASAVAIGWLIAHGHAIYAVLGVAIGAFCILTLTAPAPLAALLVLVVLNGVPLLDMSHRLPGGLKIQDLAVFALGVLLLAHQDRAPSPVRARIIRVAMIWSACFIAWWSYEVARSVLFDGIPWLKAMLFGRDFLYFALLLPLALRARFPASSLRAAGLLLLAGTTVCAVGQALQSVTGIPLGWLAHPAIVDNSSGVTRLYSDMAYIINTALIFAAALFLSKEARGVRGIVGALAALFFLDAALELTRANYFSLAMALLVGAFAYAMRYGSFTTVLRRGAIVVGAVAVLMLVLTQIGVSSSSTPVVGNLVGRASSGVSALVHSTGTVSYREHVDRNMLDLLGNNWPTGLGFLHPGAHYVPGLPGGTIRNSDTGVFNALMTMGIVGVLLIYAPLAYALGGLLREGKRIVRSSSSFPRWVLYGGAAWIAWAVAGSPTLILLFSTPGLLVTALTLAALAQVTATAEPTLTVDAA